jgi:hypothetical protein
MTTVQIKVLDEHPPPTGNPINLYAKEVWWSSFQQIGCSPQIWLPPGFELIIKSAIPGLFITAHEIWEGNINLCTQLGIQWKYPNELKGQLVAYAHIVESPQAKVRFIQKNSEGRRIVTGDARPVDSNTVRDDESGE